MLPKMTNKRRVGILLALLLVIVSIILIILYFPTVNNPKTDLDNGEVDLVRVLDVGQGDCILISSNGSNLLIDTGTPVGADALCGKLKKLGIKNIDAITLSHFHDDHSGGLQSIVNRFSVSNLILPDMIKSDSVTDSVNAARRTVLAEDGDICTAVQGMSINVGDFQITVLGYFDEFEDENDRSIFMMAKIDDIKFLFTGDATETAEEILLKEGLNLKCDVLKVGHHGSSNSTSEDFLRACSPNYAAISSGMGNMYSHPHESTLANLEKNNIKIYRTDLCGDITFDVTDRKINISTEH